MKVLALLQPWASAVVITKPRVSPAGGIKRWETRSWSTPFRGRILIHASASLKRECKSLLNQWPFIDYLEEYYPLPLGAIIGSVEVNGCMETSEWLFKVYNQETEHSNEERAFGDYSPGRFAWKLENPVLFDTPLPYRGELGLKDFKLANVKEVPGITDTEDMKDMMASFSQGTKPKKLKLF